MKKYWYNSSMKVQGIHDSRLTQEEINKIASSSAYNSMYDDFVELLKKSREKGITNKKLFRVELEIANRIIKCEKNISYFKKNVDRKNQNKEWFTREVYKAQRMAYKQIMDGIVWRFLNFDRASLRQIAEHPQTGYLSKGFIQEALKAEYIINDSDFFVILNDLTNFLRFGDLTIVSKEKIYIDEVKTKGKSKGEQKKQLNNLLENLNKKKFHIGNDYADFLLVPGSVQNFLSTVESVLKKAKKDTMGIYSERLSPYLWVSCIYTNSLLKIEKDFQKIKPFLPKPPFSASEQSGFIPMTNLFMFGEFTPNFAPYTIFPFEEELIADLIFGRCILTSHISQKKLAHSIEGKGWVVEFPSRDNIVKNYDSIITPEDIKKAVRSPNLLIHFKRENFRSSLPREVIFRINSEFLSVKAIINSLECAKSNYGRLAKNYVTGFKEEKSMWV